MNKLNSVNSFPALPSYVAGDSRIEVDRNLAASIEKMEMLVSFGFDCKHERHCGFWLIHYKFPKLKLVSGHAVKS